MSKPESQITAPALTEDRHWITEAAYYKALARGFAPNHDYEDWLEAEQDYQKRLAKHAKNGLVSLRP